MRDTYKNLLMWTLYALLFLLTTVLQTVIFGKPRFLGVKLSLVPVCVACVSMYCGSERGAIFGLCCGTFWCFSGADGGAFHILLLCLCGAVCGYLCDRYFVRNLVSAMLMSLLTLGFCQGILFLLRCYMGTARLSSAPALLLQIGLSLPSLLILSPLSRLIRKTGGA